MKIYEKKYVDCDACYGTGEKIVYPVHDGKPLKSSPMIIPCERCNSEGKLPIYVLWKEE